MVDPAKALANVPSALRDPLLAEYQCIVQNYMERRWSPAELSGGKFCEIVHTILNGHAEGKYANSPSKPRDFVAACKNIEAIHMSLGAFRSSSRECCGRYTRCETIVAWVTKVAMWIPTRWTKLSSSRCVNGL